MTTLAINGPIAVVTNGQRSPEKWAEMAVRKVITVADSAPAPIKNQAHAFATQIERLFANYIRMVVQEERAMTAHMLETHGHPELATLIRQRGT
jgi:hypothetical protein